MGDKSPKSKEKGLKQKSAANQQAQNSKNKRQESYAQPPGKKK